MVKHLELSMLDVMIAYLWAEGSSSLTFVGKEIDPTEGQMGLDLVFITKDRKFITAGAVTDKEWLGMCKAFSREDLIEDKRFKTPNARVKNKVERRKIIADEIIKFNSREILSLLNKNEVPSAPILNRVELLKNEQVIENEIIKFYDSEKYGKIRAPRPAPIFSYSSVNGEQLAPILGQNSREVLKEINYNDDQIEEFIKKKIISVA